LQLEKLSMCASKLEIFESEIRTGSHYPPKDSIWALMFNVWRLSGKIIEELLCALLCMTVMHNDMHSRVSNC